MTNDQKLTKAAQDGDEAGVIYLLANGTDANGEQGLPLIWAAYYGHMGVVEILLEAGADRMLCGVGGRITAEGYARKLNHHTIVKLLQEYKPKPKTPEEIILQRSISNRILEEVFDFTTLERFSLLRNGRTGPVEAMTREPFSAIEDETTLRKAFNEHVRRGGAVDETLVFPHTLPKAKLMPKG